MDSRFLLSSYTIRDGDAHISLLFPAHFLRLVTIHGPVNSNCVCPLCGKVYLLQKGMALYTFKHSVPYLYSNRNKKKLLPSINFRLSPIRNAVSPPCTLWGTFLCAS